MYLRSVDAVLSGAVLAGCLRSGRSSPTPVSSCCCSCLSDQVDHQDPVVGKARYRLSNFVDGHFAVPETQNTCVFLPFFKKLKPILGKKTQGYGGNCGYQERNLILFDKVLQSLGIFIHF